MERLTSGHCPAGVGGATLYPPQKLSSPLKLFIKEPGPSPGGSFSLAPLGAVLAISIF